MVDNRTPTIKSKIVMKDLGDPRLIATLPENQNKLVLGSIIGSATDIITRTSDQGEVLTGLRGSFEAMPMDEKKDVVRADTLWLQSSATKMITDVLMDAEGNIASGGVKFGFEVAVVKATNPLGYTWSLQPMIKPAADDPLNTLRAQLLSGSVVPAAPALEKPKEPAKAK